MEINRVEALSERVVQTYAWGDAVWHVWRRTDNGVLMDGQAHADQASANASGQPLVLLHGGSGSWTHWVRNVEHLSQFRTVWALDIPGVGDSSLPTGVSDADDLVPYMADIMRRTFDEQPIDVMGFSFGGMTAGLLAAAYPKLIRRLILIGAPGLGLFGEELPMRGMTPSMDEAAQRHVHRHNLSAMMFKHAHTVTEEVINLQQANVARDRLRRRRIARTNVLARAQSGWTCPVHGVWGEGDALYLHTLSQVPQVLTALASFTVVPDAGHWLMYERPSAFHEAVEPLLRSAAQANLT
jgi:pimeloyl-ACP methyl ester carboxylesterase